MDIVKVGRAAQTDYADVKALRHVSLLRCTLLTGRTHQIRVHLKHLGHPLVGDPLYSGPQWRGIPDKRVQKLFAAFPRQALHSWRLTLPDGRSFEAALPQDMRSLIGALR